MVKSSQAFLDYLDTWKDTLPALALEEAITRPETSAIISIDVINGFCYEGPLSSPRVKAIIAPIVNLFERAWESGLRNIVLTQDTHEPEAVEFGQFPPHCIRGTSQSETVPEFKNLPFYPELTVIEKNSISSVMDTGLEEWVQNHPEVNTYIVVGDCTDLCIYQMAMYLRLDANVRQLQRRIIVPANAVDTYDMPVETAKEIGAMAHDGDLLHAVFLYHMALNGIEVASEIC